MPRKNGNQADRSHDLSAVKEYHSYVPPTTSYPPMPNRANNEITEMIDFQLQPKPPFIREILIPALVSSATTLLMHGLFHLLQQLL